MRIKRNKIYPPDQKWLNETEKWINTLDPASLDILREYIMKRLAEINTEINIEE